MFTHITACVFAFTKIELCTCINNGLLLPHFASSHLTVQTIMPEIAGERQNSVFTREWFFLQGSGFWAFGFFGLCAVWQSPDIAESGHRVAEWLANLVLKLALDTANTAFLISAFLVGVGRAI